MNKLLLNLTVALASVTLVGCISHKTTVCHHVERVKVEFENEAAGRIFYEKLSHLPNSNRKESRTEFAIPLVFEWENKVETDDNERFNDAVRRCDTNNDGKITEKEAKIFSAQP